MLSKKRRDKEHDSSTLGKVAKLGAVALTAGVGATALNRIGITRKLTTEVLPALGSTHRTITRDLRASKAKRQGLERRLQAEDLVNVFNTHLKDNVTFKNEIRKRQERPIAFNLSDKRRNVAAQVIDIKSTVNNDLIRGLRHEALRPKLEKQYADKFALKYKDKDYKDIYNLTKSAFEEIDGNYTERDGKYTFSGFLDKRLKASGFGLKDNKFDKEFFEKEKQDFFKDIVLAKEQISDTMKNKNLFGEASKQIEDILFSSIQDNRRVKNTLFGKIDKTFGISGSEMFFTGARTATLDDFLSAYDSNKEIFDAKYLSKLIKDNYGNVNKKGKYESVKIINELKALRDKYDIGDIIFDRSLKIDKDGNFFSTVEFDTYIGKQLDKLSSTFPGKLFAGVDIRLRSEAPIMSIMRAGSTGKEAAYELMNDGTMLSDAKIALGNASTGKAKLYDLKMDDNGYLRLGDKVLDEGFIVDNSHGKSSRLMKDMLGTNINPLEKADDLISKILDLKQDGSPLLETKIKAFLGREENLDWKRNILKNNKNLFTGTEDLPSKINKIARDYMETNGVDFEEARINVVSRIVKDQKAISDMLNDLSASKQINDQTIINLIESKNITNKDSLRLLNILLDKDYLDTSDLVSKLSVTTDLEFAKFYNKDLENILNRGYVNINHLSNMQNISQTRTQSILSKSIEYTNVLNEEDVIRREVVKEVMLREASGYSGGFDFLPTREGIANLEYILQNSNLTNTEKNNLSYLADWGIIQGVTKIVNDSDDIIDVEKLVGPKGYLTFFNNILNTTPHLKARYSEMLDDLASRHSVYDSELIGNINQVFYNEYNSHTFIKQSVVSRLNQVQSINDLIKQLGNELSAGRNNMNDYTTLTQATQFMVSRLAWGVEAAGLGFSSSSTGSTLDLVKNIAMKRVLPVMGAFALYDYLDYESEKITGVSMTGAMANTISNLDIAGRRLAYGMGLGQAIDWFKESSVIAEYWTGSTDFQTAEERQEWYETGYSAVRGGRFWGFGSTSEFRGSGIQYYQPNYLRRAHSNWKDVGIYGSSDEKFKHSWLPSLRYPLSPLVAAMDPYWLEKKNMDERPYPLTGKMFSEGTPWGAILNPTVGEILKPVRMLPEIKKRLGSDGRDIRTVVKNINERIKNIGNKNDDMLILRGTDIRTAEYVPYANTGDGYMNIQFSNGQAVAPGLGYMENVGKIRISDIATGQVNGDINLPTIDANSEFLQELNSISAETSDVVNGIVNSINNTIKKLGARFSGYQEYNPAYAASNMPDRANSTYVYTNLVNQRNQFNSEYYSANYDPGMVDRNLAKDYMRDVTYSMGQLAGIYGFLGDFAFGEQSYSFRYENAGQMTSFSRHFWDAQFGGIGDDIMEIARRFFASDDKSRINYNPLRNTMPEWLPERFLTGDPYTSLPKGEMRMPGRGYESLHDLHPDQFGEYGAFDRMKILGDIAPTSQEYKLWRNIARNTVTDPNLIKQMDEIEERAAKMSSKHEFYSYRYFNNNTVQKKGVVKSWDGNIITLVSGEQLRLGGIELTEEADLSQFLQVGQKIHYRTSADAIKRLEDGIVTNAVIYKRDADYGMNINKELVKMGMAERDRKDNSAIGYLANSSAAQQTLGSIQEIIAHAKIPYFHNKFMRIETARESFRQEHVYGTSFATWDNPIHGFVKPFLNQTFSQGLFRHAAAVGASAFYFARGRELGNPIMKYASGAVMAALNPTALLGMGIEFGSQLGLRAIGGGSNMINVERGAAIGSIVGTVGWGLANAENPLKAASSFAIAGEALSKYLNVEKVFKNFGSGRGALLGAGIGLTISAIKNPRFTKEMFRKEWIPESTEKKYELDEYFDRLEYIKYRGLYKQAAFRAAIFEGNPNINRMFKRIEKNKEKIAKLTRKAEKLSNKYSAGGYEYEQKMAEINNKIMALENQQTAFRGGKYTKAAISYRKAMESTIYGLKEGATSDEILSAVPVQYRDHFMAFMNETSAKERKKILKQLPEYLRRPLQISWGEKPDKVDSNLKFFRSHAMPGMAWRGWKPNVNLKHVKMKTIQNEGMLLSDFGYYESEKSKMEYHMAEGIEDFDRGQGAISYISNMTGALSGLGMSVQNISVEPTSAPGLWIAADIKQTSRDISKIGEYTMASGIQTLTSLLF